MADVFNVKKRSDIMSKVRSNNNKSTELKLIQIFKENSIVGWKRKYPVKGHPDFVFLDKKSLFLLTVVFGMDTIAEILFPRVTRNIGTKRGSVIFNMMLKLLPYLNRETGK